MAIVSHCSLKAVEAIIGSLSFLFFFIQKIEKIFPCFICLMNHAIETDMSFKDDKYTVIEPTLKKQTNQ